MSRPTRILLDVAAWDPRLTSAVLEELLVKKILTIADAESTVALHSRQGRPGLRVLRSTAEAWTLRQRPPDSVLEARFAKLCREFALPEFEFQRSVDRFRPDFSRPAEMVIVECDGYEFHNRTREQVERDRERDAELIAAGWAVLHFTWHQINNRGPWVANQLRRAIRTRAAQLASNP